MSFCPHTEAEISAMLSEIECDNVDQLFREIPKELIVDMTSGFADPLTELQVTQLLRSRAQKDAVKLNFIGAGCYEHYIPAAVWEVASRGEFLTSYTPYQAEASQGTLQLLYEFQTMMANLTGLEVSNASMYDGATALAEAVLMAVRCCKTHSRTIIIPDTVHPFYREVVRTIVEPQNIEILSVAYDPKTGCTSMPHSTADIAAIVVPQPNFFGVLEDVDSLTNWGHQHNAMVIALVNPSLLSLLKPPGEWGEAGADIACGEAQCLGVPLASGGPYVGFLCCKQTFIRQLPGRLVGMTSDIAGNRGFTLTLQAREQHIRRAKATSNICTNQGLLATAVTIYLSLLGAKGLRQVALQSHAMTTLLKEQVIAAGVAEIAFNSPFLHEVVLRFKKPVQEILDKLAAQGIQGGFNLTSFYPELGNALLCCATETKTAADIAQFIEALKSC